MDVPFAIQSYKHDSLPISAQRTLNLYAEKQVQGAKTPVSLHGDPGITTFATAGNGPIRGFHMLGGLLYAVSGTWLYSITDDATPVATQLGGQVSGTGIVSVADNGEELMIANGDAGYLYDTSAGFQSITDADFTAGNTTAYHSGRFVADRADTAEVAVSDSLDGSAWGALAFATKEAKSDNLLAVLNVKEILHLGGVNSFELWGYTGAANFPFARLPGGTLDKGILSPYATAQEDEALFMLGSDRMAYKVSGAQLQRVSQHAIETTWQGYTSVSDCFGLSYSWRGHKFVAFTFPSQEVGLGDTSTWVLDLSTGLWHEKLSYDLNGNPLGRWRINCAIEAYGKVLVGDSRSGKIGYLDGTVFTEFGDPMYARAVSPPYAAGEKRLFTSRFGLHIESGVGLSGGEVGVEGNDTYTKALLHFNGTEASTTITDDNEGGSSHTWTANGNAQIDTDTAVFGGGAGLFDGTGDYASTPDHADFTLGSGDFTIDCRFKCNVAAEATFRVIAAQSNNTAAASAWQIFRTDNEFIAVQVSNGVAFTSVVGTTVFTNSVNAGWHHLAVVRTGNVLKLFIDGVQEGGNVSFTGSVNDSALTLTVGSLDGGSGDDWQGWVDEFRLSVGTARWTAAFTPPSGPYQTIAEIAANNVGVDPQIMLDISDDGGRTFGTPQLWTSMGAQGAYRTQVKWDRLGSTEPGGTRVFGVTISDPVKRTILGAFADMKAGM